MRPTAELVHLGLARLARGITAAHELHHLLDRVDELLRKADNVDAARGSLVVSDRELDGQAFVVDVEQVVDDLVVQLRCPWQQLSGSSMTVGRYATPGHHVNIGMRQQAWRRMFVRGIAAARSAVALRAPAARSERATARWERRGRRGGASRPQRSAPPCTRCA